MFSEILSKYIFMIVTLPQIAQNDFTENFILSTRKGIKLDNIVQKYNVPYRVKLWPTKKSPNTNFPRTEVSSPS